MSRYLAVIYNPRVEICVASAERIATRIKAKKEWNLVFARPGMSVFVPESNTKISGAIVFTPDNRGVVIGTLFEKVPTESEQQCPRVTSLQHTTTQLPIEKLCHSFWGSYVAFFSTCAGDNSEVFRGPMSTLPCFHIGIEDAHIFFSSVEDFISLKLSCHLSINWDSIRAQASKGEYITRETGIKEVFSVLPGESLEFSGKSYQTKVYWSPWSQAGNRFEGYEQAALHFRSTTRTVINSWAGQHESIVQQLSGGFDSSVVLACLSRSPSKPHISCVNFYSSGAGDERKFARCMASSVNAQLVEFECNKTVNLRIFFNCALTSSPVLNFSAWETEPKTIRFARDVGATAIFTGELGDNIFGRQCGPEFLAECIESHGIGRLTSATVLDYARITKRSFWNALSEGLRYRRNTRHLTQWSTHTYWKERYPVLGNVDRLITDAALAQYESTADRFIHPWFKNLHAAPLGALQFIHALQMVTSSWTHSPFAGENATLFTMPLVSQPLVDLYMQIPSYFHIRDGESGSIARTAFADDLPLLIKRRGLGKGILDTWIRDVIATNRQFLEETLLDGILSKHGILDRRKTEAVLSGDPSKSQVLVSDIFQQLYIEAWLRRWSSEVLSTPTQHDRIPRNLANVS